MEVSKKRSSQVSVGMSTVVLVTNRCQFCYAFFKDAKKVAEHSNRCVFRFSETFEASDGKVKFACAVCFDVFQTRAEHARHEQLHKFPGGFPCSICDKLFLNDLECVQHMENDHGVFKTGYVGGHSASMCNDCGAFFEQESHLRLHNETNCGKHRSWHCMQCNRLTEDAYNKHMKTEHKTPTEIDDVAIIAKVEDTLNESENIRPVENVAKTIVTYMIADDPLHLELKEEDLDTANTQNAVGDEMDYVDEFPAEGDSSEKESIEGADTDEDEPARVSDAGDDSTIGKGRSGKKRQTTLECKYCNKKYSSEAFYYRHIRAHGPDGTLIHKCECCYTYFKTKEEQMKHTRAEHKDRVTCKICNKVYKNVDSLYSHRLLCHAGRKKKANTYFCAKCGASFTNRSYLDAHEKSDCGRSPTFKCDDCGKLFISKFSLKNHRMVHSDDRKFACDICKKRFKNNYTLKTHLVTHSSEKPHQCQHCDKRFADSSYLKTHMTLHEEVKRYVCYCCGTRFPTNSALHKHRKTRKDTCALVPIQPPLKNPNTGGKRNRPTDTEPKL